MKTLYYYVLTMALIISSSCSNDDEQLPSQELETENKAPLKATLLGPTNDEELQQFVDITLSWKGEDPDGDPLTYEILLDQDPTQLQTIASAINEETYTIDHLIAGETYYWKIRSTDTNDLTSLSDLKKFSIYEKVWEGNLSISSQADLDNFESNGYTRIAGNFFVGQIENPRSNQLKTLHKIDGGLWFSRNNFIDLEGLENLTSVGELGVMLTSNNFLETIEHLKNLKKAGSIVIDDNPSLISLDGLQNITELTGRFFLADLPLITNLDGFPEAIKEIPGNLYISKLPMITNIDSLQNIEKITGTLNINFTSLNNFNGLSNLTEIGEDLRVTYNDDLTTVNFPNLAIVKEYFNIANNENLTSLNFDVLSSHIGTIAIISNPMLSEITGFNNLTTVTDYLSILGNDSLIKIDGFNSLSEATENLNLQFRNNDILETISGFNSLTNVAELTIFNNDNMSSIILNTIETANTISLNNNDNLTNIALENLNNVATSFEINTNPILTNYCGLSNYASLAVQEQKEIDILNNGYNPTTEMIANATQCQQ
ncbi:hypothetical protein J8L88_18650 [Aquimarina sp. MMG015]|uniref:hypothetical protein n=1 Tax=Aquimarina sp. MMG015 TaxID=2822689 RepID=UPI001B39EF87|nr:hypothetical protein [Aquimarina sp. MMG015]MBQ4804891.1 hypothetical protein [Aquimarina sp. MMG015]